MPRLQTGQTATDASSPSSLGIAAEHLRYGNTRKEPARQYASHYKQQKHYRQRYPDTLRSQQGGELYNDRVFHKIAEVEHYQRHQQQCRHNDDTRFQQNMLKTVPPLAPLHLCTPTDLAR